MGTGILLFVIYALVMFSLAGLGAAMGGSAAREAGKPITKWTMLGMWLLLMAIPVWVPVVWPINRLGHRVPVLGAPFKLGRPRPARRGKGERCPLTH